MSGASESETFEAYRRHGSVGVRNNVLVLPSVICSHIVADRIAESTDCAVSVPHDHGCAQIGDDNEQTRRTLRNLARNPNIAGACVVGLGCEHVQSGDLAASIDADGVPVRETSIQDAGGSDACLDEGRRAVTELVDTATNATAEPGRLGDLTVGVISSDLRQSTRETADPLVGEAVQELVESGGRVLVAGTERLAPHGDAVQSCATNDATATALEALSERYADRPSAVRRLVRRSRQQTLADVTRTWGDEPVREVVAYGDRPSIESGLAVVDTPSRFEEAATALAAAGASVVVHVTAEGIPTGHPVVPVLKITGDSATAAALPDDIDLSAEVATPAALIDRLRDIATGEQTAAEEHGLVEFAINRTGPSM